MAPRLPGSGRDSLFAIRSSPFEAVGLVAAAFGLFPSYGSASGDSMTPVIDRVAVVVEGQSARDRVAQVATLWDLFVVSDVQAIRLHGPEARSIPRTFESIGEAQDRLAEQLVALREAVRLGRGEAPRELVDEARDVLAERIGGHEALREFLRDRAVSFEALDEALRREVVVARFTRDSVRSVLPEDPMTIRERFDRGGHPFEGVRYEDVEADFLAWAQAERFENQRRLWLLDLRSRCRLRIHDVSGDLVAAEAPEAIGGRP